MTIMAGRYADTMLGMRFTCTAKVLAKSRLEDCRISKRGMLTTIVLWQDGGCSSGVHTILLGAMLLLGADGSRCGSYGQPLW